MRYGEIIGVGNTANVYEWEDGKVIKLFKKDFPKSAIELEFNNAMLIRDMDFSKPKAYEIVSLKEGTGIIYDKVVGESLLDLTLKTGNIKECAECMAGLHKKIGKNRAENLPSYKEFLRFHASNAVNVSENEREEALHKIDLLPEGNLLCHGDFHLGNIIMSEEGRAVVIDLMNICCGNLLYDVARTVFLLQYTPVPPDADNREIILSLRERLTDLYLGQMNVSRDMIKEYLSIIAVARKGECPNEQ